MKKLSSQTINTIICEYRSGVLVSVLSNKYSISKLTIYYHLRKNYIKKRKKPSCYKDFIWESIYRIENNIKLGVYKDNTPALNEIRYLKDSLKKDISKGVDAFILQ